LSGQTIYIWKNPLRFRKYAKEGNVQKKEIHKEGNTQRRKYTNEGNTQGARNVLVKRPIFADPLRRPLWKNPLRFKFDSAIASLGPM
jgi:hypothetical protein